MPRPNKNKEWPGKLGRLHKAVRDAERVYIAGHVNPDGDAIGASLALAMGAAMIGKQPVVLLDGVPERFAFIPGQEYVRGVGADEMAELAPGLMIAVDTAYIGRLPRLVRPFFDKCSPTAVIDHHMNNPRFGDINLVDQESSSASEIMYELLSRYGLISADIATALIAGIIFDTGGFKHSCCGPETLRKAADLLERGAVLPDIYAKTLETRSAGEARILSKALDAMVMTDGGRVAYSVLSEADMAERGALYADLDGIPEYMLSIRGAEVSFLLSERPNYTYKLSLRSKAVDVCAVAAGFGGGGHILAAGAVIGGAKEPPAERVLEAVRAAIGGGNAVGG
ncbi:MAG: DHH family phosphoesterase [Clostridiales bacterium]|nr:DHH family phosphoesterase [Clostridiales bacterium]